MNEKLIREVQEELEKTYLEELIEKYGREKILPGDIRVNELSRQVHRPPAEVEKLLDEEVASGVAIKLQVWSSNGKGKIVYRKK